MLQNEIPIEWFRCPVTKEKLFLKDNSLWSSEGTYHKDAVHNYWNFFPRDTNLFNSPQWETWRLLQKNGIVSYRNSPTENLGIGKRLDFLTFAEFCDFHGIILDIGVGPQKIPTHIEYCRKEDTFFIGIDPLVGEQPRNFQFVLGLGEFLPFKERLFDQVLFVTSLDHFIDPNQPIAEAKRVLRDDGQLCVWFGEKDKNANVSSKSHEWYEGLSVPKCAEDKFHYKKFTNAIFCDYIHAHHFKITSSYVQNIDQWRRNYFYKLELDVRN